MRPSRPLLTFVAFALSLVTVIPAAAAAPTSDGAAATRPGAAHDGAPVTSTPSRTIPGQPDGAPVIDNRPLFPSPMSPAARFLLTADRALGPAPEPAVGTNTGTDVGTAPVAPPPDGPVTPNARAAVRAWWKLQAAVGEYNRVEKIAATAKLRMDAAAARVTAADAAIVAAAAQLSTVTDNPFTVPRPIDTLDDAAAAVVRTHLIAAAERAEHATAVRVWEDARTVADAAASMRDRWQEYFEQLRPPNGQRDVTPAVCPTSVPDNTLRKGAADIGVKELCGASVLRAPTADAAKAIGYAFKALGAPYACNGVGREGSRYDCSSLVARAYGEGAGVNVRIGGVIPSTRNYAPWGGYPLAPWLKVVDTARAGDFVVYRTCTNEPCSYQHVVMYLSNKWMLHTNACGDVAHVTTFWGLENGPYEPFGVRRVTP